MWRRFWQEEFSNAGSIFTIFVIIAVVIGIYLKVTPSPLDDSGKNAHSE